VGIHEENLSEEEITSLGTEWFVSLSEGFKE